MNQPPDDPILLEAIRHHQSGKFAEAEALYRKILSANPDQFDALHYLGVLAGQFNRHGSAIDLIRRALSLRPDDPEARFNLATNLAAISKNDDAIGEFTRMLQMRPDDADAHFLLADLLRKQGRKEEAIVHLRRTIALRNAMPDAHNNLGNLLQELGDVEEAIQCFRRAMALRPGHAEAMNNLGNALRQTGDIDGAMAMLGRALELQPKSPQIRTNLANVLRDRGEHESAIAAYRDVLSDAPRHPEAWNNLGVALRETGKVEEARAAHAQAHDLRRDYNEAKYAEAWARLLLGDFEGGWLMYDWRPSLTAEMRSLWNLTNPKDVHGKRVLLRGEQGFGDTIQFARYSAVLEARGGRVILECQPELVSVFEGLKGVESVFARGEPVPTHDAQCPLMSVPGLLKTTVESIPADVPYIDADPVAVAAWGARLTEDSGRRVGLAWAGRSTYANDKNRSIPLAELGALGGVAGVTFHSLQTGEAGAQVERLPGAFRVVDHRTELKSFADTAALIANLDLVISVDTAVAHLAGAMGRPVWTMLPFAPDWRWMLEREDSPWYPTMRLFRQRERGKWSDVVTRVATALGERYGELRRASATSVSPA